MAARPGLTDLVFLTEWTKQMNELNVKVEALPTSPKTECTRILRSLIQSGEGLADTDEEVAGE